MKDDIAQKSEVHEVTDDASTSPASNEQQHLPRPHTGGETWPAKSDSRGAIRTRTNVAGIGPAESDDILDAPPGHVDLNADLDDEKPFYPTTASSHPDQKTQNLSP